MLQIIFQYFYGLKPLSVLKPILKYYLFFYLLIQFGMVFGQENIEDKSLRQLIDEDEELNNFWDNFLDSEHCKKADELLDAIAGNLKEDISTFNTNIKLELYITSDLKLEPKLCSYKSAFLKLAKSFSEKEVVVKVMFDYTRTENGLKDFSTKLDLDFQGQVSGFLSKTTKEELLEEINTKYLSKTYQDSKELEYPSTDAIKDLINLLSPLLKERPQRDEQTLFDDRHLLLFNNVFENHNEDNSTYLDKISSQGGKTIELDYDKTLEKDWVMQWKLRTASSDKIVSNVIKKIQDAKKDETIKKMSLAEKGIYIGRFDIEGKVYTAAIYSEQETIDKLTKVVVYDKEDFETVEIKKRFRTDETIIDYTVLAFYEESAKEPVSLP